MSLWTPNCSFGGVPFSTVQTKGPGWKERLSKEKDFSVTDLTGGNHYLQLGGDKSQQWSREIVVPAASYAALEAKYGQQATLTIHGSSYTATLVALTSPTEMEGVLFTCSATWVV